MRECLLDWRAYAICDIFKCSRLFWQNADAQKIWAVKILGASVDTFPLLGYKGSTGSGQTLDLQSSVSSYKMQGERTALCMLCIPAS